MVIYNILKNWKFWIALKEKKTIASKADRKNSVTVFLVSANECKYLNELKKVTIYRRTISSLRLVLNFKKGNVKYLDNGNII